MPEEKVYFNDSKDRAVVTSARFIVPDATFAIAGVTSVKQKTQRPPRLLGVLLILLALFAFSFGVGLGMAFVVAGAACFAWPAKHSVLLSSASGESRALTSTDVVFIRGVIAALNKAIVERSKL